MEEEEDDVSPIDSLDAAADAEDEEEEGTTVSPRPLAMQRSRFMYGAERSGSPVQRLPYRLAEAQMHACSYQNDLMLESHCEGRHEKRMQDKPPSGLLPRQARRGCSLYLSLYHQQSIQQVSIYL